MTFLDRIVSTALTFERATEDPKTPNMATTSPISSASSATTFNRSNGARFLFLPSSRLPADPLALNRRSTSRPAPCDSPTKIPTTSSHCQRPA